jgi:hypothetical protein
MKKLLILGLAMFLGAGCVGTPEPWKPDATADVLADSRARNMDGKGDVGKVEMVKPDNVEDVPADVKVVDAIDDVACNPKCGDSQKCILGTCHQNYCAFGLEDFGCCAGPVWFWCSEDSVLQRYDCSDNNTPLDTCGWDKEEYKCGGKGEDPTGVLPLACCVPDCTDKECDSDGCWGNCGECEAWEECNAGKCNCVTDSVLCNGTCCPVGQVCADDTCCLADCEGKSCGDDLCGESCGTCTSCGEECIENTCSFTACEGKECGSDNCGGLCGMCDEEGYEICTGGECLCLHLECVDSCCDKNEVCFDALCCQLACDGKDCGDDGCGGECGECVGLCQDGTCCLPECDAKVCGGDGCGGECGPDCNDGLDCTSDVCTDGTCKFEIDTGCLIDDGCFVDESNKPDSVCWWCAPNNSAADWTQKSDGVACGNNATCQVGECMCIEQVCGEICCDAEAVCLDDACCQPQCQGKTCGDDGCGGSCGECGESSFCYQGECHGFVNLPDTGQQICYDDDSEISCPEPGEPFFGQDGNYLKNSQAFEDNGNGTVTDLVTGLVWGKCVAGHKSASCTDEAVLLPLPDAMEYCAQNGDALPGEGWRLPTRIELLSIVHFDSLHCKDGQFFPATGGVLREWTSTDHIQGYAYVISNATCASGTLEKTEADNFRCVRGSDLDVGLFLDQEDGTVVDLTTGMMWQQGDDEQERSWEEALSFCEALVLAEHEDWRVPTAKEIATLVDNLGFNFSINEDVFLGTPGHFWSATTFIGAEHKHEAYALHSNGALGYFGDEKVLLQRIRCVRSDCTPECEGKECGHDNCGGVCGDCQEGGVCVDGACCSPQCGGKECGDDGCGGSCGQCGGGVCLDGACCQPNCLGKVCGDDGCGGTCWTCGAGYTCTDEVCSPEDSLQGHWKLDEFLTDESGLSAVADSSSHDHDASIFNAKSVLGKDSNALHFDGNGDYGEVTPKEYFYFTKFASLSVSFWMQAGPDITGEQALVCRYDEDEPTAGFIVDLYQSNIRGRVLTENGVCNADGLTAPCEAGSWHHVAMTFGDSFLKLYIDGSEAGSQSCTGNIMEPSGNVDLHFACQNGAVHLFEGTLDDIRLFNRVLAPDEVAADAGLYD